jgi:hypothetical protein
MGLVGQNMRLTAKMHNITFQPKINKLPLAVILKNTTIG